jgi:hypothetical protein
MSLSMWIVCSRMGIAPIGDHLGRIAVAAVAAGLLAWGLREAGIPTVVWVAIAGVAYGGLVIALGAVKPAELRALAGRGGA